MCHLCTFNVAAIFFLGHPYIWHTTVCHDSGHFNPTPRVVAAVMKVRSLNSESSTCSSNKGEITVGYLQLPLQCTYGWQGPILVFITTRKWCAIIYVTKCFGRHQLVRFPHEARIKRRRVLSVHEMAYNTTNIFSQNIYTDRQNIEWAIFLHSCMHDIHLL